MENETQCQPIVSKACNLMILTSIIGCGCRATFDIGEISIFTGGVNGSYLCPVHLMQHTVQDTRLESSPMGAWPPSHNGHSLNTFKYRLEVRLREKEPEWKEKNKGKCFCCSWSMQGSTIFTLQLRNPLDFASSEGKYKLKFDFFSKPLPSILKCIFLRQVSKQFAKAITSFNCNGHLEWVAEFTNVYYSYSIL